MSRSVASVAGAAAPRPLAQRDHLQRGHQRVREGPKATTGAASVAGAAAPRPLARRDQCKIADVSSGSIRTYGPPRKANVRVHPNWPFAKGSGTFSSPGWAPPENPRRIPDGSQTLPDGPRTSQTAPRWPHDGPRMPPDGPRTAQTVPPTFCTGLTFLSLWTPRDGPQTLPDGTRMSPDGSRTTQDGLRTPQDGPRTSSGRPQTAPGRWRIHKGPVCAGIACPTRTHTPRMRRNH